MAKKNGNGNRRKKKPGLKRAFPVVIPADIKEVNLALHELGQLRREIDRIDKKSDKRISKIMLEDTRKIGPLHARAEARLIGICAYARKNRQALTARGRKTVKLAMGQIKMLTTREQAIFGASDAVIVRRCEEKGLNEFVRIKKEPDKAAMHKHKILAQSVEGVSFGRRSLYVVKPNGLPEETVEDVGANLEVAKTDRKQAA